MNRKRMMRTPRLVMACRESNTVVNNTFSDSQDLMILKIRRRRNALNIPRPPPSADSSCGTINST